MCGIVFCSGMIYGNGSSDDETFREACDLMMSRGPDGVAITKLDDPHVGPVRLGHRRLAIVDTSNAGTQPMWSDCGRYVIVYNGEVYNADALRDELLSAGRTFSSTCDTEVLVNGFAEWGEELVDRITGMFAFAIWDDQTHQLFVARDRLGIKPLYVAEKQGQIALASDLRVLELLGFAGGIDADALGAYLMLGYVPTPYSILKGAKKLEAGHTLKWCPGYQVTTRQYWAAPREANGPNEPDLDALSDLIDQVTKEHLMSDVPLGVFLSGGLDSSLIASSLVRHTNDVRALTIGYPNAPDEDEAPIAVRTAQELGIELSQLDLGFDTTSDFIGHAFAALDEPLGYSAIVSQMAISHAATKSGLKVVLSGDGGDEVFGGYAWYNPKMRASLGAGGARFGWLSSRMSGVLSLPGFAKSAALHREANFVNRSMIHRHMHAVFPALRSDEVCDLTQQISIAQAEEVAVEALRRHDAPDLPEKRRLQRIDLMTFCEGSVLPKVDRTSMATGLEVRPPLLDHRIVEWGLTQPISHHCDGAPKNAVRTILRRRGLDFLMAEKKRGFSLKGVAQLSNKSMMNDLWQSGDTLGLFKNGGVSKLHPATRSHKMKIQCLYFFDRWQRVRKGVVN